MRHLFGIVLAVVMAALLFVGAGYGVAKITFAQTHHLSLTSSHSLAGFAALAVTGLILGILLAVPAVSPLATGLPGLGLLAWSALLLASTHRATQLVPLHPHSFASGFSTMLTTGVLALVGAIMIIPLFIPSRWRWTRYYEDDYSGVRNDLGLLR
jgi:hypothetical protein